MNIVCDTTQMKPGETPEEWRVACMKAKLALWRNSGMEPTNEQLAEGLATNADEVRKARATVEESVGQG